MDPMASCRRPIPCRTGRTHWAALVFLIGFTALLLVVCYGYLVPAMEAAKEATDPEKRQLVGLSRLLLVVVLLVLYAGLLLTFRVGRFFLPRSTGERTKTQYVDAWAESAKRVKVPDAHEDEDDGGDDDRART